MGLETRRFRPCTTIFALSMFVQTPFFLLLYLMLHKNELENFRLDKPNVLLDSSGANSLILEFGSNDKEVPNISGTQLSSSSTNATEGHFEAGPRTRIRNSAFRPLSSPSYPFVLFSAYRHTLQTFYVIGSTSVIVRQYEKARPVFRCEWISSNSNETTTSTITEAQMHYVSIDEQRMPYVAAIVNCTFGRSVGEDNRGGLLRLHLSKGPTPWNPHHAVETVFHEEAGSLRSEILEGEFQNDLNVKLQNEYAFCGPPIHCQRNMDWTQKWLAYHHYIWRGKAHFYIYDVCRMDGAARAALDPWLRADLLTIVEASGEDDFPAWWKNQVVFMNDCLQRTRFVSRWTFFHDFDELLYVSSPNTLDLLLEGNKDAPWMSFANLPVNTSHCTKNHSANAWYLERMLWREERPECGRGDYDPWLCPVQSGRRKIVVNPRKVLLVGVHKSVIPEAGGVVFNGAVARVHHYRYALDRNVFCSSSLEPGEDAAGPYRFDDSIASLVPAIRKFAGNLLPSNISY